MHVDLAPLVGGDCNDLVADARGHAYVGNFGFEQGASEPRPADLVLVRPDETVEVVATGLQFPNGSVVTPDGSTLIVGESMGARYSAFTIRDDGTLTDRRVWAEVPGKGPDGCVLDEEGALCMADAFGSGCFRVAEGGELLDSVTASQPVFACTLGGPDRRTLYMTTAPGFGASATARMVNAAAPSSSATARAVGPGTRRRRPVRAPPRRRQGAAAMRSASRSALRA